MSAEVGPATPGPAAAGFDAQRALALAARTFDIEARALQGLAARLGDAFPAAVQAVLACRGRVVVMGMGKSGHVGAKIAATLASTGTPAFFVHPAEASHGDLGMVQPGDVVLAISNSGEVDELAAILPPLRRLGVTLVAMTGKGLGFTVVVDGGEHVQGIFTDGDLRRLIERGADLRSLRAADVMHPRPRLVSADALAVEAASVMEQHRVTSVLVVDAQQRLVGALNSNDLMRAKVI
jgi:CBS domain-containing protein